MGETLELWSLFRWAILAAVGVGVVSPLAGAFLYVRRTSFHGLALPQFAATGVACGFAVLPWWIENVGLGGLDLTTAIEDSHAAQNWHFAWAALATFGGLGLLTVLPSRGAAGAALVAASFAVASGLTIVFAHYSPLGAEYVTRMLEGQLLGIGVHQAETLLVALGLCALAVLVFHRDWTLVSFDADTARVLGKRVLAHEAALALLVGVVVSAGTMTVGPIVLFGLLVLPPIGARALARSMVGFLRLASILGGVAAVAGVELAFRMDWPLGPAVVVAAAVELVIAGAVAGLRR